MTFVTFFSLYYLFKDDDKIIKKIMQLSPLKDKEDRKLLENFNSISKATLKGSLVIAIIQGILTGFLFWITGIPSPVLWALVTTIVSLIPLLGSALIWLPAGFIMLFLGNFWQAIVIFAFGATVISLIDNILRPKLVGDQTSLHPILVFLSTLGGIALFGITGILLGPVFIVFFVTLLDIYQSEFKKELERMNQ
jgi:predicted PurR-regulated permease PerM